MFRRQVKTDRAAQFRAALARHGERANSTADAEHEFELATKVKDIFHFARNDVIPVSAVISFNSRVFRAYRNQNSLADVGAVDGLGYPYLYIFQSVELDDVEALLLFDDFATEAQDASQKILDKRRLRMFIDFLRPADLFDAALVHQRQPRRERHGFDLIMGDEQHGKSELLLQSLELDAHLLAQFGVEIAQRLIEEKNARRVHQRPRQRHPLLLSAAQ